MRTTKHIQKLAEVIAKKDIENSNYWTDENLEQLKGWNIETLQSIKNALIKGTFYAGVKSVSKSGMSRKIELAYIKNNKLIKISDPEVLKLAGVSKDGRISGCGMDMLFHAQYSLFHNLHSNYKKAHYQKRMARYNTL